jgi:hypothetical protein
LQFKTGAKLGFLSTFFGVLVAIVIGDLIWLFFDYQLWHRQNGGLFLAVMSSFVKPVTLDVIRDRMAEQAVKPFNGTFFSGSWWEVPFSAASLARRSECWE